LTAIVILKRAIFVAALIPAGRLVAGAFTGDLTANPIEHITHQTGWWALAFLTTSLAITPIRRLTKRNEMIRLRRMLGLYAFFYASLHLLVWITLDNFFDTRMMFEDIFERPFVTVGMATYVILLALGVTSTAGWVRRLGRRWQRLHRLVYVAAVGAVMHFWWLVKADVREPLRWAIAVAVLLGFRLWWANRARLSWRS
jgi:sulfoxide reductase heme-binding subunit YedZ